MNGKLKPFKKTSLLLPPYELWVKQWEEEQNKFNVSEEDMRRKYQKLLEDDVYANDEYQVNIEKNSYSFGNIIHVWHLSIKRLDKEPIHDWRDLQAIKNMLVGEEYEAVEIYPAESRLIDSANQFHLWVFHHYDGSNKIPSLPLGFIGVRNVTSIEKNNSKQRAL